MKKLLTLIIVIVLLFAISSIIPQRPEKVKIKGYTIEEALRLGIEGGRVVEDSNGNITIFVEVRE